MNILFIASSANIKARSGEAIHIRELAVNLAKLGHHVSLIAGYSPDSSDELYALENHPNIKLYYNKNIFAIPFPRSHDISGLLTCFKVARENPPDVIYERNFTCKFGTVLSKILRKPFIIEINGIVDEEQKLLGTYKNPKLTGTLRTKIRRFLFNSAKKIVTVSPGLKEGLQKAYHIPPDKIVVIPNGANTDIFRPMDQKIVKKKLGLDHKTKYVCFVGKLAPWQGVEYLVQAAPIVLKQIPESKFLIVGDGMMQNELESAVKDLGLEDKFVFTGNVPFEVVPKYISASDVCVAPFIRARNEKIGLSPLKIYEYLACGKPVVGSNIQGVGDFLEKSDVGISFTSEDHVELAHAIIKLLLDIVQADTMGENGRKMVFENYSWENTAMKVVHICNSIREN